MSDPVGIPYHCIPTRAMFLMAERAILNEAA